MGEEAGCAICGGGSGGVLANRIFAAPEMVPRVPGMSYPPEDLR